MNTTPKEEMLNLFRQELPRLLAEIPEVRLELVGLLSKDFVQAEELREAVRAIKGLREDFNRGFTEHSRRMDELREDFNLRFAEHSQRMDEFSHRMEEFAERQEEHSRRMDEMREDFNRGFAQHSREIRELDLHIQALGARWGILAEGAFREGMAGILTRETGFKVERYLEMDTEGRVFGRPDQVEIDVVIHNGDCLLLEVKSSISRGDVSLFQRKVAFYERKERVEVKRSIMISPYFDPGARELAQELGIETYTSAHELRV